MRVAGRMCLHSLATPETVAAAWLHDTIEDCGVTRAELETEFSTVVAEYVSLLTNPSKGSTLPRAERKRIDREHLAACPPVVQVLKLLDRIDNVREMQSAEAAFLKKYAGETLELAEAIGGADEALKRELLAEVASLTSAGR